MAVGDTLHRIARSSCSSELCGQVLEPAIADLQHQYAHAGRARLRPLLGGYAAFWWSFASCLARDAVSRESRERRERSGARVRCRRRHARRVRSVVSAHCAGHSDGDVSRLVRGRDLPYVGWTAWIGWSAWIDTWDADVRRAVRHVPGAPVRRTARRGVRAGGGAHDDRARHAADDRIIWLDSAGRRALGCDPAVRSLCRRHWRPPSDSAKRFRRVPRLSGLARSDSRRCRAAQAPLSRLSALRSA